MATIEDFVKIAQGVIDENDVSMGNNPAFRTTLSIGKGGRKYARIVASLGDTQRSVHCFVEIETGNILKAAGWKTPAKHARGNINDEDGGRSAVTAYGAVYLA
jgi:hypothetical protein